MSSKKTPLVVYIDDNHDILSLVSDILQFEGINVMCTTDPDVFFEYFLLHEVDLAILDAEMPEKSGYELCEELRSKPGYPNVPIVFLSGHQSEADKLKGFFSGATEYLSKPVNGDILVKTVKKLLSME